jgi:AcrR family transcriptional regulator
VAAPLAERLVDVTEKLLAREGIEGLSLRSIARRAGVTHGAPARHYRGLAALLSEVAARGFRELSDAIDTAAAAVPIGAAPGARVAAAARAYVRCGVAKPALFALMFRPDALDPEHGTLARDSRAGFEHVVRIVRGAQDAGWRTEHETRRLAGSIWALSHGLALLWAQGAYPIAVGGRASLDGAVDAALELVIPDLAPNPRRRRTT